MGDGVLRQLDASLSVLRNDVASDVWLALRSHAHDSVVSASFDVIAPYYWRAHLAFVAAYNLDPILVTLLNDVVNDAGAVVVDFDSHQV